MMNEREAIELLKHYRHQYANDLQLVLGYAQLGKVDLVQEKATELIKIMSEDQSFHNLPLPKTIVTILQLNNEKSNLTWKPIIDVSGNIVVNDQVVAQVIKTIHQVILEHTVNSSLYHGTITFQQNDKDPFKLLLTSQGDINQIEQFKTALLKIEQIGIERANKEELRFNWTAQE